MSKLIDALNHMEVKKLIGLEGSSIKISDLMVSLEENEIYIPFEIIELHIKIIENTKMLYNNPQYNSLNEEELLTIITNEINTKFCAELLISRKVDPCQEEFDNANEECLKDFGSSLATVGVIGLLTSFGVGSLIGGGIALIQFGECNKKAQTKLEDCREQQNK